MVVPVLILALSLIGVAVALLLPGYGDLILLAAPCTIAALILLLRALARRITAPLTLPPTFIQRERDSGFEFCPFGRVGQRGLARSFADCAASGPVAG